MASTHARRVSGVGLQLLDVSLNLLHGAVVVALLTLWLSPRTRRWHLALVLLTAVSWLGLGSCYGWGYCFLTDWHWRVKAALGQTPPPSFIQYLVELVRGRPVPAALVDTVTAAVFGVVSVTSIALNLRDWLKRRPRRSALV